MNQTQQVHLIQIHSKQNHSKPNSDQTTNKTKYKENNNVDRININSYQNAENDGLLNQTNPIQTFVINQEEQQINKEIRTINIKDQLLSVSDEEEKRKEMHMFQKPGTIDKGYVLYSDKLMEHIIADQIIQKDLIKQFQFDRETIWCFENEKNQGINELEQLKVLCITWNMHGSMPQLCTNKLLRSDQIEHHVIVVSSQECLRSIPMSIFCESKQKWEAHLQYVLGNKYELVKSVSMNALHLGIFMVKDLVKYATAISIDQKATGVMNLFGNKGGVAISMDIGDKSYLFLNSHFSSGQNNNEKRNQDYQVISQSLNLPKHCQNPNESLFKRFHYIFWMGDFNYRIDAKNKEEVDELINTNKYFDLLKRDQLMAQRKIGQVFSDFQEGLILFPPSYRVLDEQNKFTDGSDARIPGWTDRILFKQKIPDTIKLLNYESALDVFGSDHRPVFAQFLVKAKFVDTFKPIIVKESAACNIF
ncbi:hypothetical protein ABPG72_003932 [Tetrahymena utriculariae]